MGRSISISLTRFLIGLFLICMCGLMLQIIQTRLLSVIAWYYLAFFAISMAMFGMTAGALLVYFNPHWFQSDRLLEHLSWITSAFAIAVVLSSLSIVSSVLASSLASGLIALLWFKLILTFCLPMFSWEWQFRWRSRAAPGRLGLSMEWIS